ncbi:hypothetical protein ILUMI_24344 [Ignelater luminosus]|uniref:Uncharacterized protein n=1 Tax=Ignelater luminosus TaxID=2038154 RepID=A0A8K0CCQ9_IGNLU|nr:hypothetical protein ILUMI_24344 [Ignelater luminosus]
MRAIEIKRYAAINEHLQASVMIWMDANWTDKTKLCFVPHLENYTENIFIPIVKPSNTHPCLVQKWLKEKILEFIAKEDWPSASSDLNPPFAQQSQIYGFGATVDVWFANIDECKLLILGSDVHTCGRSRWSSIADDCGGCGCKEEDFGNCKPSLVRGIAEEQYSKKTRNTSKRVVKNVVSEEIPEVTGEEIRNAMGSMKNGRAPGEDRIGSLALFSPRCTKTLQNFNSPRHRLLIYPPASDRLNFDSIYSNSQLYEAENHTELHRYRTLSVYKDCKPFPVKIPKQSHLIFYLIYISGGHSQHLRIIRG